MKLSSIVTYLLPVAVLVLASALIGYSDLFIHFPFLYAGVSFYKVELQPIAAFFVIVIATGFYMVFKLLTHTLPITYIKYILLPLPLIIHWIVCIYSNLSFLTHPGCIVSGGLLYWAFYLFYHSYNVFLEDDRILFKNLFNQSGEIILTQVTKMEKKKNWLTTFRPFKLATILQKAVIIYTDEEQDNYQISFFIPPFRTQKTLSTIITRARIAGNVKISSSQC